MPHYKTVGFHQDIIAEALSQISLSTVLVFPSKRSAATAERSYYPDWHFEELVFTSMDDLKSSLILPSAPALQEDKRLLGLYRSLSPEDKEFFHINEYSDIVGWGQQFLRFFDDLAEEMIDPQSLASLTESGSFYLQHWQEQHIEKILGIRTRYLALVQELGFSDKLFSNPLAELSIPWHEHNIIFVNQYYYSALERELIKALEEAGNSVLIMWQGPEASFDFGALKARDIKLEDIFASGNYLAKQIDIIQTDNADQMVLDLLLYAKGLEAGPRRALLDSSFTGKYYSGLINSNVVYTGAKQQLTQSFVFQLLLNLQQDLKAIRGSFQSRFVPIQNLLNHLADQRFAAYFCAEDAPAVRDDLLHLAAYDFIYLDIELLFFDLYENKRDFCALKAFLSGYFSLIKRLLEVDSIEAMCKFFDSSLPLETVLSADEQLFSDAPVKFYERLANFRSIQSIGLIPDLQELFGSGPLDLPIGLLELLLESLKTCTFRWKPEVNPEPLFELSNLLDSRNLSFDQTVWFHVNEGIIPSSPEPVWLLNESQRKLLGLKTFADIHQWERYYFYRLLMVSGTSRLYCYRIPEQDIEPGSFISELEEHASRPDYQGPKLNLHSPKASLRLIYENHQQFAQAGIKLAEESYGFDNKNPDQFFVIPSHPEADFGDEHMVKSSYYNLDQMLKSPFVWYIRFLKALAEPVTEIKETLSRKLFGSIIHSYLSLLLKEVKGHHRDAANIDGRLKDRDHLWEKLTFLLEDPLYRYKLPQNYNWDFLRDIIADCIIDTIQWFFVDYLPELLEGQEFVLIPESERMTEEEKKPKKLLDIEHLGITYSLYLRGKADLRIETKTENFIIDFKTGESSKEQLIIYEWVYYLILDALGDKSLSSHICKILEQESNPVDIDDKKRQNYYDKIKAGLSTILSQGFGLSAKTSDRQQYTAITRSDLYSVKLGSKDAEL